MLRDITEKEKEEEKGEESRSELEERFFFAFFSPGLPLPFDRETSVTIR